MCGIIGYVGNKEASKVIIQGLKFLEYRGYDSAGIAVVCNKKICVSKKQGRIVNLENDLKEKPILGHLAIGHTRWATHGEPCDNNAHPFIGNKSEYAVAHNGIIENYLEIKEDLVDKGVQFHSKTDSEVVVHLLEYLDNGNPMETIMKAVKCLKGSFALAIINANNPNELFAVKKDNPLIIGNTETEGFICSDVNSLQNFLKEVVVLDNGQIAVVKPGNLSVYDFDGHPINAKYSELSAEEDSGFDGFECYMDKEMNEIPKALERAISNYRLKKSFEKIDAEYLKNIKRINIVACGTALHAGLVAEKLLKKYIPEIDVYSEVASEFKYDDVKIDGNTLTITVSQSGETADTLICQKMVDEMGGKTLTVCNVPTSSMVHYSDFALEICAGKENAVASTKAYNCQDLILAMFVIDLAKLRGKVSYEDYGIFQNEIDKLPMLATETLKLSKQIEDFAVDHHRIKTVFYLGRGMDYCVAMEGSLKLKEISYIHCEAYPAGELKHGTLALIEKDVQVIALVNDERLIDKMYSGLSEVKTRGAEISIITAFPNDQRLNEVATRIIPIPKTTVDLSPIISVIPTQLISYFISRAKGCDIDKPRNLAKSVTVE